VTGEFIRIDSDGAIEGRQSRTGRRVWNRSAPKCTTYAHQIQDAFNVSDITSFREACEKITHH
jgi:hypothetical protein